VSLPGSGYMSGSESLRVRRGTFWSSGTCACCGGWLGPGQCTRDPHEQHKAAHVVQAVAPSEDVHCWPFSVWFSGFRREPPNYLYLYMYKQTASTYYLSIHPSSNILLFITITRLCPIYQHLPTYSCQLQYQPRCVLASCLPDPSLQRTIHWPSLLILAVSKPM
jgi:hypothetical protein